MPFTVIPTRTTTDPNSAADINTLMENTSYLNDLSLPRFSPNYIINGAMEIAQRGTSFAAIATGMYSLDRWVYEKGGAVVHTVTQDADVPSGEIFKCSIKLDVTTADSSIAATDYCLIAHRIEGYNFATLVGKTATLSFWVKGTKTGIHCVAFRNSGNDRAYIAEYTINAANTWEFKTITLTFDYSGGTWNYTSGVGVGISFILSCGSTYQSTSGSWITGNYAATSNQVNETDSTDNNFYLTGVMLNEGSGALDFRRAGGSYGGELALCQRYYESSDGNVLWCGATVSGSLFYSPFVYKVTKRVATTPTFADVGVNSGFPATAPTGSHASVSGGYCVKTSNSTVGAGYFVYAYTVDAEL